MMKRTILNGCCLLLAAFLLTGCVCAPRILVDTATLQVSAQGGRTTVKDLAGGEEYHFTTRRVQRGQGRTAAAVVADSDTVRIELQPGGGLYVLDKTTGQGYKIQKGGRLPWAD